jgi:hypothetical protein
VVQQESMNVDDESWEVRARPRSPRQSLELIPRPRTPRQSLEAVSRSSSSMLITSPPRVHQQQVRVCVCVCVCMRACACMAIHVCDVRMCVCVCGCKYPLWICQLRAAVAMKCAITSSPNLKWCCVILYTHYDMYTIT